MVAALLAIKWVQAVVRDSNNDIKIYQVGSKGGGVNSRLQVLFL